MTRLNYTLRNQKMKLFRFASNDTALKMDNCSRLYGHGLGMFMNEKKLIIQHYGLCAHKYTHKYIHISVSINGFQIKP
jgi:hypothetical protein